MFQLGARDNRSRMSDELYRRSTSETAHIYLETVDFRLCYGDVGPLPFCSLVSAKFWNFGETRAEGYKGAGSSNKFIV